MSETEDGRRETEVWTVIVISPDGELRSWRVHEGTFSDGRIDETYARNYEPGERHRMADVVMVAASELAFALGSPTRSRHE